MTTELEEKVLRAVKNAGLHAKKYAFAIGTTEFKSLDDPVTNLDRECERMFEEELGSGFNYWGEEFGHVDNGSDVTVYLDPIDGTKSFTRGDFETAFTATAVKKDGEQLFSVVYDFMRDLTYLADTINASILTPQGERVTIPRKLPQYSKQRVFSTQPEKIHTLPNGYEVYQQSGSVGLGLAQVATGAYAAFHAPPHKKEGRGDIGDLLAGIHILEKAGYKVTDLIGEELDKATLSAGVVGIRKKDEVLKKFLYKSH